MARVEDGRRVSFVRGFHLGLAKGQKEVLRAAERQKLGVAKREMQPRLSLDSEKKGSGVERRSMA